MDVHFALFPRFVALAFCTLNLVLPGAQATNVVSNCKDYRAPGGLEAALATGGTVTFTCSGTLIVPELIITTDTTIDANGQKVTLSGNKRNRVLCVTPGTTLNLMGLAITDGRALSGFCGQDTSTDIGGAIVNNSGTLVISNSTLSSNSASSNGGAILNLNGTVTIANSTFSGNSAGPASGGGGAISNDGSLTITHSTFSANMASSDGGAILHAKGSLTITDSTFSGNSSITGAAIENMGTVTIANSTFSDNKASGIGGAIANLGTGGLGIKTSANMGAMTITNSTFSGNAAAMGGGVHNASGTLTITNSTLSRNSVSAESGLGGGLYNPPGATLQLKNTIVAGNIGYLGPDIYGEVASKGHNLIGTIADTSGFGDTDLLNVDPNLAPPTGDPAYYPLAPGSPAINAGDNVGCPPTDQAGTARPQDGTCDIGAFEYVAGTTN